jgi:putative protease
MNKNVKIELMSPAGSWESLRAAVDAGADSVYFGVEQLNMRARASNNFTLKDLKEISEYCHSKNVRTYITLNTIIYDHDLSLVKKIVNSAKENGISAIIASDQAVIAYARSQNMEVHISTQLNVTNIETVKFYSHFADVIVLSRELSLNQVKKITEAIEKEQIKGPSGNLIQIELFGHGALCMAVSGKCYLSLHTHNSSANRGACVQNCRRTYTVIDNESGHELLIDNEYIMSPKDLCTIDFLDKVAEAGIKVLKIEGRGRAPEYVKTVTQCYREAIDALYEGTYTQEKVKDWMERLKTVYNRGFWSGYYLGQKLGEWHNSSGSKATLKKVYVAKGVHYYPKTQVAEFEVEAQKLKKGDKILISGPTTGLIEKELLELYINGVPGEEAKKGDRITFKLEERIRTSDKLYKLIPNPDLQ